MILKSISVDCVIFGFNKNKINVLLWQAEPELIKKFLTKKEEYEQIKMIIEGNPALKSDDFWGLIGTHLQADEDLDGYAKKNSSNYNRYRRCLFETSTNIWSNKQGSL